MRLFAGAAKVAGDVTTYTLDPETTTVAKKFVKDISGLLLKEGENYLVFIEIEAIAELETEDDPNDSITAEVLLREDIRVIAGTGQG